MKYPIPLDAIIPSIEFFDEINILIEESKTYLGKHKWCGKIEEGWLFTNLGYVLNIFLYRIDNRQSPEDNLIWVIVGDFPPMYLDTFNVSSTKEVLENYLWLVGEWIQTVELGKALDDCFPLESNTTNESLDILRSKVSTLKKTILPSIIDLKFDIVT